MILFCWPKIPNFQLMYTSQFIFLLYLIIGLALTVHSEDACKNEVQKSPINIEMEDTTYSRNLLVETNVPARSKFKVMLINNSLRYELEYEDSNNTFPEINWLQIDDPSQFWDLNHIEFHWNSDDTNGSEHSINGKYGAAELQLYYFNPTMNSFEMAKTETNEILVQVIILNLGNKLDLAELLDLNYTNVANTKKEVSLSNLISLTENRKFFKYEGSIGASPCVMIPWLVMEDTFEITEEQLRMLRSLSNDGNVREQSELTKDSIVLRNFDKNLQVN